MTCKRRLDGGCLEVGLTARGGVIEDIRFRGDFMAMEECVAVADALRDVKFLRRDVEAILNRFDLHTMFGSISGDDILDTIFYDG